MLEEDGDGNRVELRRSGRQRVINDEACEG